MRSPMHSEALLHVDDLRTYFHTRAGTVRAVDGVSFSIGKGETLGIVGESGSGKSVACYSILRLIPQPPGRFESGRAMFDRVDLLHCSDRELQAIRGNRLSMIFQDPMTSLNPYMRIGDQVIEPLLIHRDVSRAKAWALGVSALREVGIQDAENRMRSYPHEFSGGMRQRVMIAMALITKPELLIADEPTTALDVTVQAQILELLGKMQEERGTAVIFITHDIGIVSGFCDRALVMYAGRVLEAAPTALLFYEPKHPYNQALQRAIPALNATGRELYTIPGAPPDASKSIAGCPFAARCEYALEKCLSSEILLKEVAPQHFSACLRVQLGEIDLTPASAVELSANN
ncbi:MAG: ABC transporter ATP-binding protein [Chthoniobacterales bacterium]|nr:ABC transporter ATP-binding protein [Chthoniobacterales bacterium]